MRTDAVPGTGPAVIEMPDGTKIGGRHLVGGVLRRPGSGGRETRREFIANPTNGASYSGTVLQTQQVASSRLRAVETGRWVVQAAPTGFSAFVSPSGDVDQRTGVSERAVIVQEIDLRTGETWYVTLGDGPLIVAILAVFLVSVWFGGRGSRSPRAVKSATKRSTTMP